MAWGAPGSHEQLSMMSTSSSGNPSLSSGTGTQPLEHSQHASRNWPLRGTCKAGATRRGTRWPTPEDVHSLQSTANSGGRTRRTGLLTVMERPPGREQKSMERFSPVRRGSEGSAGGSRTLSPSTPQQECQRLQRGLQSRASPPRSIPGSPIHQQLVSDQPLRQHVAECASPIHQFYPSLPDASLQDFQKFSSVRDPTLGLPPENYPQPGFTPYDSASRSPSYSYESVNRSPLHTSPYATNPSSNLNSPIQQSMFGQVPGLAVYSGTNSPILNPLLSPNTSPVFGGYSQTTPGTSVSSITQGISGLNTASTGSITQGIPSANLQLELRNQQLHDDSKMDTSGAYASNLAANLTYAANFLHQPHHMHILNIHNHRSLTNSPISNPGSPGLDMIQEEIHVQSCPKSDPGVSGHPQISVTDVLGSEVTLVAGSDTSEDSMDSLENQKISKIPSFIISEPSENLPSITRGIGRKTSQEADPAEARPCPRPQEGDQQSGGEEFFLRRNSDKSSCYSDDSLSNDSLSIGNQSPSSSSNTQSSHAFDSDIRARPLDNYEKMQITQELTNAGTENFQIFQNLKLSLADSGVFTVQQKAACDEARCAVPPHQLAQELGLVRSTDILEMVKKTINDQIPPKTCFSSQDVCDRLSLEYEGGIQIELKIVDKQKDSKGLKMRRISGDHLVYNQLCQQLISCMTVS
ncbi:hypothetical protein NQ318_015097 [Aromia moschata]|uniref:non-specific serine/threonine protein kinase n=1 Tax=Aromia moschata TaxID=1265417 RepID=A0AAV8YXA9_9CUCU|nr:hypothetical protein NQ318_015097 [Aromia moschata]